MTVEIKEQFVVYDKDNEATAPVGKGWDNCWFDTWEQAVAYANKWLGDMGPFLPTEPGVPFSYGPGCSVVIYKQKISNFLTKG